MRWLIPTLRGRHQPGTIGQGVLRKGASLNGQRTHPQPDRTGRRIVLGEMRRASAWVCGLTGWNGRRSNRNRRSLAGPQITSRKLKCANLPSLDREGWMRRREFIAGLGSAAAWPLVARGQHTKAWRVGFLSGRACDRPDRLRRRCFPAQASGPGLDRGQASPIECGSPKGTLGGCRLSQPNSSAHTRCDRGWWYSDHRGDAGATSSNPIVMTVVADPIGSGSWSRPGRARR